MNDDTVIKQRDESVADLPPGFHVELAFISGPDRGMVKRLWKETTVLGRSEGDIKVDDPAASKRHAALEYDNGELVLRDLESTNGTSLNGSRVWEAVLANLDEITIGETVIKITIMLEEDTDDVTLDEVVVEHDPETDTTRPHPARISNDPLEGPLPEGVKASFQVAQGADEGARFELEKKATIIGRAGSDVVLHDLDISRKHASIEFISKDRVIIKDLRSKNGTLLNKERISVATLKNGDLIQAGSTTINFFVTFEKSK